MWGLRVLWVSRVDIDGFFKTRLEIIPVKTPAVSANLDKSNQYKMMYGFLFFNKKPTPNQTKPQKKTGVEGSV